MKVEIKMRVTNKAVNAIAKVMEPTLEHISTDLHTISFETQQPTEWLTPERRKAFEDKYNEVRGGGDVYYLVDKISITN